MFKSIKQVGDWFLGSDLTLSVDGLIVRVPAQYVGNFAHVEEKDLLLFYLLAKVQDLEDQLSYL